VGDWATRKRLAYTTYRDLSEKEEILRLVQQAVQATNEKFARVENVRKFRMITKELDHEDGELTATQKVKRSSLTGAFQHLVDDMYEGRTDHAGGDQVEVHAPARPATEDDEGAA
jgi:long-chain acyl-CoA synthetase